MDGYKYVFEDYLKGREQYGYDYNFKAMESSLKTFLRSYRNRYVLMKAHDFLKKRNNFASYDILFVGTKMMEFVNAASNEYNCGVIVRGQRSRKELDQHNCDTIFGDYWINELYKAALSNNKEYEVDRVIDKLGIWLKKLNPSYIILFSNTGFFERAIVAASQKYKIVNIKLQHGMMHHNPGDFQIANISDYIWVWSDYFKELILDNTDIESKRVIVFGYPYEVINDSWPDKIGKICFLGQQDGHPEPFPEQKYEVVSKIKKECDNDDLEFFYRPHPTERKANYKYIIDSLKDMNIQVTSEEETLKEAFTKYDMFISFFSTALIDAYMNKRYCLQILMDWSRKVDNLQKMGVGNTIYFDRKLSLKKYIDELDFNNNYKKEKIVLSRQINNSISEINKDS